ncbi:hypothetical protein EYF80_056529 [Liparis tanakae]|uniref:Uncharacterized protein n=1 Tax=Liparis tanakae TaxID=230148 RepID=A0A4Z2EXH9_9TELE|nr:hypothetical protein EYF80_056529 [Liparis tanakae]
MFVLAGKEFFASRVDMSLKSSFFRLFSVYVTSPPIRNTATETSSDRPTAQTTSQLKEKCFGAWSSSQGRPRPSGPSSRCRLRLRRRRFLQVDFGSGSGKTKVSGCQSGHQGELPRQHRATHHAGQLTGVLARLAETGPLNAEHLNTEGEESGKVSEKRACCGARLVPPPTVPSSMEGMVQVMYRSAPSGPAASIWVMQLELPTV